MPVKERRFRRRVINGKPKFEVKIKDQFVNFNKVVFVNSYSYKRNGRIIRVKDHIRKPFEKRKRKRRR